MRIRADRRSIRGEARPEDVALVDRFAPSHRRVVARLAVAFARIDDVAAYLFAECGSLEEFAGERGFSWHEARDLVALGHAFRISDAIRESFLAGRVTMAAAAVAGRALRDPELVREGDDWLLWAEDEALSDLRKRLRRRREEKARRRERLQELSFHVPERVVDDFQRAQDVASRKAKRALTPGQTFECCVTTYLDCHDPQRKKPRARRVGPTSERPRDRYVPAAVRREIAERSGDRCEVPGCPHRIFVQKAHLKPHRHGGGREARDLANLCTRHHVMLDAGRMAIRIRADGGRDYVFRTGRVLRGPAPADANADASKADASKAGPERPARPQPRRTPNQPRQPTAPRPGAGAKRDAGSVTPTPPTPRDDAPKGSPRRTADQNTPDDRVGERAAVYAGRRFDPGASLLRDAARSFAAARCPESPDRLAAAPGRATRATRAAPGTHRPRAAVRRAAVRAPP